MNILSLINNKSVLTFIFATIKIIITIISSSPSLQVLAAALKSSCVDKLDPWDKLNFKISECPLQVNFQKNEDDKLKSENNETLKSSNMFVLEFNCLINDQVLCEKMNNTFQRATGEISRVLKLNSEIVIKADFESLGDSALLGKSKFIMRKSEF